MPIIFGIKHNGHTQWHIGFAGKLVYVIDGAFVVKYIASQPFFKTKQNDIGGLAAWYSKCFLNAKLAMGGTL